MLRRQPILARSALYLPALAIAWYYRQEAGWTWNTFAFLLAVFGCRLLVSWVCLRRRWRGLPWLDIFVATLTMASLNITLGLPAALGGFIIIPFLGLWHRNRRLTLFATILSYLAIAAIYTIRGVDMRVPAHSMEAAAYGVMVLGAFFLSWTQTGVIEVHARQLEDLSLRDPLTGLYNRRFLDLRLREEMDRANQVKRPFSLLMMDIDHFKHVNDSFGHQIGDDLLCQVAARLLNHIRPSDCLVRYGGEELAVIMPRTGNAEALLVGERVRTLISERPLVVTTGNQISLTVSVGVATYPDDAESTSALVRAADQALYAAKASGRNAVVPARAAM